MVTIFIDVQVLLALNYYWPDYALPSYHVPDRKKKLLRKKIRVANANEQRKVLSSLSGRGEKLMLSLNSSAVDKMLDV